jgi:hypothetical protein
MSVSPPEPDEALTCLSRLASSAGELHQYVAELTRLMSAPAGSYAQAVPLDQRLTVMEHVSRAVRVLTREGNLLRRLEAQALYAPSSSPQLAPGEELMPGSVWCAGAIHRSRGRR